MTIEYKGGKPATLSDALMLLSADDKIAIGSDSAFMFIGTVAQWRKDEAFLSGYYRDSRRQVFGNGTKSTGFKPFPERKIKDIFYRYDIGGAKMLTLIIEGAEIGTCWFEDEYQRFAGRHRDDFETT